MSEDPKEIFSPTDWYDSFVFYTSIKNASTPLYINGVVVFMQLTRNLIHLANLW